MSAPLTQPFVQLADANGPISGGTVTFYAAGTTNTLSVYADSGLTTALPNPMTTNAAGYIANASGDAVTIFLQDADYDLLVEDDEGNELMTIQDFNPSSGVQSSDNKLDALSELEPIGNELVYFTGPSTVALAGLTSFARSLLDDSTASAFLATLGYPQVPTGSALFTFASTAPTGWLMCDGSAVSRTTYADLFAEIGTSYGAGDGSTTFNLPDAKGRSIFGKDDMGGTAANRLRNSSIGGNVSNPDGTTLGATGGSDRITVGASLTDTGTGLGVFTELNGMSPATSGNPNIGLAPISNVPPAIVANIIIKT